MKDLWYNNPFVLFTDFDEFFPDKYLSRTHKINAIARFAIYYSIIVVAFKQDLQLLSVGIVILLISYFLGATENFVSKDLDLNTPEKNCQKPTKDNPFMNYTVGDLINNKERSQACLYDMDGIKEDMRKEFRSKTFTDTNDLWGQYITDRSFYTNPNTDIVNDQTRFGEWLLGSAGLCKTTGKDCLKFMDPGYQKGRVTQIDDSY